MYRLIAYLGILASIILGGILGLIALVLAFGALEAHYLSIVHLLIGIALGASIGGILAVIRVRRYLKERREKQLAKHLASVPENADELIKSIIRQMRYRKEVRQDVMAELVAHFEDGLKDCKSDEEKEQKAQQLIDQFGDAKLLAVLLRRAKKRCRPLWRTVVARTFQAAGVLILCLIVYLVWFLTGKPVVTVDYVAELNRIVRPVADESLNAAALYHKAVELYKKSDDDISKLLSKKYNEVTPKQKQLIEKWLESHNEALELVIAGSKKPYYWRKYETGEENTGEMMAVLLPHLAEFRRLAYALRWRIWLSAEKGRYENAFSDIKSCYRFGKHIRNRDVFLVEQLVGMALERLATQTLRGILNEREMNSAILGALQQDFEQMIADENFTVSFKFEKLAMYDEIQRCFTQDRLGGGHLYLSRVTALGDVSPLEMDNRVLEVIFSPQNWPAAAHFLFMHPNKRQTRETADRYYAWAENNIRKTPAQIRAEGMALEEETTKMVEGNLLLQILTPAIGRICEIAHRNKIDVEAALTVIAILRYKQDVGDYPENLDELIEAGLLKALSVDPYSDEPLVYKRTDSDFVLYGFGPNFKDDGGTVAVVDGRPRKWGTKEEGDWVFWPWRK